MLFFKNKIKSKTKRIQEGLDIDWVNSLPGTEYNSQNPNILCGAAMVFGTRDSQQDAFAIRWIGDSTIVAMVCDGMGGLNGGEIASKMAIESVMRGIESLNEDEWSLPNLFNIIKSANYDIQEIKDENGEIMHCGTTMTLAVVRGRLLDCISVGDSRIYYVTEGHLRRVTKDHNYAFMSELLKDDESFMLDINIRQDALVSYLGAPALKYVDYNTASWQLKPNDKLLLCSDGITKLISDEMIEEVMDIDSDDMDCIAHELIQKAESHVETTQDNTTVVLLKCME